MQNESERYEARYVSVRVERSPSILFAGMEGSVIPIAVAHGEGRTEFSDEAAARRCSESGLVAARFVTEPMTEWRERQSAGLKMCRHLPARPQDVGNVIEAVARPRNNAHQRACSPCSKRAKVEDLRPAVGRVA